MLGREDVNNFLIKLEKERFFGKFLISYEAGKIISINKSETFKDSGELRFTLDDEQRNPNLGVQER